MPEGHQDHGRVPEAIAVILRRLDQAFDLRLGQMLARPQLLVRRPFRSNCSIYGGWRDQPQAGFGLLIRPLSIDFGVRWRGPARQPRSLAKIFDHFVPSRGIFATVF